MARILERSYSDVTTAIFWWYWGLSNFTFQINNNFFFTSNYSARVEEKGAFLWGCLLVTSAILVQLWKRRSFLFYRGKLHDRWHKDRKVLDSNRFKYFAERYGGSHHNHHHVVESREEILLTLRKYYNNVYRKATKLFLKYLVSFSKTFTFIFNKMCNPV